MENELEFWKDRLKSINEELHWFWEDHLYEKDPGKILVLWGRLTYMIAAKMTAECNIERIEREIKQNAEIH